MREKGNQKKKRNSWHAWVYMACIGMTFWWCYIGHDELILWCLQGKMLGIGVVAK